MSPHIPPPVLALAAGVTQRLITPGRRRRPATTAAAAAVFTGSLALGVSALDRFRRSGTSFDPIDLSGVSTLVTSGPNRVTRNPMYVALAGSLVAQAIDRQSWRALLPIAGFVGVMNRTQIAREEEYLRQRFGADYTDYRQHVPRWIGLPRTRSAS